MKFDDNKYFYGVFSSEKNTISPCNLKKAHNLANECRNKEIDRFWERGKYFWAFILASYTAHFSILGTLFYGDKFNHFKNINNIYLEILKQTPYFIKIALLITSFLALFFSVSWILINKGSKFWQKNWEEHVDMLENKIVGKLYKTYLNTEDRTQFSPKIIGNLDAYDYSVSKVTLFGSIVLSFISFIIFGFYCALCIPYFEHIFKRIENNCLVQTIITISLIMIFIALLLNLLSNCKGNPQDEKQEKWVQKK